MNYLINCIRVNAKFSSFVLIVLSVACVFAICCLGFWIGLSSIFLLYFIVSLYVFAVIEPKEWEATIIFLLYLAAAVVFIGGFSGVSLFNQKYFGGEGGLVGHWSHAYFSASMFTSLGFSSFQPKTFEAQFFSVAQSLLGSAHGVSFIFVMLGRSKWVEQKVQGIVKEPGNTRLLELRMRNMSNSLNFIIGLLVLNLLVMLFLLAR